MLRPRSEACFSATLKHPPSATGRAPGPGLRRKVSNIAAFLVRLWVQHHAALKHPRATATAPTPHQPQSTPRKPPPTKRLQPRPARISGGMEFGWHKPAAEVFVPSGIGRREALQRTTHLAIGAHPDDLEIMCWDGILAAFRKEDQWFTGVTVTNGSGSPRGETYADFSDQEMVEVRLREQRAAAMVGEYSAQVSLMYSSAEVRENKRVEFVEDLVKLLESTTPEVLYTHNLVDKHRTHIAIATCVVEAARRVGHRPKKFLGCEVWRGLDWIPDSRKVVMDVSAHSGLTHSLVGLYDSQITGGKRYELATGGRKRANATFFDAYQSDSVTHLEYALDMLPLLDDPSLSFRDYVRSYLDHFQSDIYQALERH